MAHRVIFVSAVTACLIWVKLAPGYGHWAATHWVFTYDEGLIKRGLVGSLVALVQPTLSVDTIMALQRGGAITACSGFALTVIALLPAAKTRSQVIANLSISLVLITAPGTMQQVLHDVGRFDAIGLILLMLAGCAVMKAPPWTSFTACSVLSVVAVLIHEGFLLWTVPMAFGLWLWKTGPYRLEVLSVAVVGAALVAVTAVLADRTYADLLPFETAQTSLQARASFAISEPSLEVQYRSLGQNISYTASRAWSLERAPGLAAATFLLAAWIIVIARISVPLRPARNLCLACCFAPLALMVLGQDHARWLAMINANLALWLLCTLHAHPERLRTLGPTWTGGLLLLSAAQLALGPFGIGNVFPNAFSFVGSG